jgi:hypothetical protein
MGGNTLQPDDFVLNEDERKPEDAELKSDFRFCHDSRQWYLVGLVHILLIGLELAGISSPFFIKTFCIEMKGVV